MRRPWYRTRAYRLARTIVVGVSLLVGVVFWDRGEDPGTAATALPPDPAGAAAVALPGDSRPDWAAVPGGVGLTPTARPRPTREPVKPGPRTGTTPAHPSRTPAPRTPGPRADGQRTHPPRPPAADPKPNITGTPAGAPTRTPTRTPARTARPPRPPATLRTLPPSRATRLLIPYLRVDAPIMDLGLDREHRLTAPPEDDPKLVGWYKDGASPGGRGTAVAVGHLDTDSGPAVFAGLTELKPGRIVKARRADGRIAVYTVDKIKSYEKAHFPSQEVYGARSRPELRLITCGGSYDRRKGYSGNVVVFAHLTGIR
ncbi:class F sortase [Streptomyces sp. NPDC000070]|uniref:class F sortase n=1 Tax=Streptomyces sp. NPDC000070 TaxID=3154240 RepID=UPI00332303AF